MTFKTRNASRGDTRQCSEITRIVLCFARVTAVRATRFKLGGRQCFCRCS